MGNNKNLEKYHQKRDFDLTGEPFGGDKGTEDAQKKIFVVQKHEASSLHFDFRLLVNGVLKSWAVPKGPSSNPDDKRLAVETEDHPVEYADFEGTIPEDQYGGGNVMVWDAGTYVNEKEISIENQLKKGRCTFVLNGKRLRGSYTLIKFQKGKQDNWILKKVNDKDADSDINLVETENTSVLTGRTMEEIEKDARK